jgi:DNA polymerase-3 subunit epsilon
MSWWLRWRHGRRAAETALAANYAQPLPALSQRFLDCELLAVDFETTGLDPATDRILSIGWVLVGQGRIRMRESGHLLVNCAGDSVGHSATIHGLVDSDLSAGIALPLAVEKLLSLLAGRALLAHCAAIEVEFLTRACRTLYGVPPLLRVVDSMTIEMHLRQHDQLPTDGLRLHACRERYQLPRYRGHNAAIDALACAELLLAQATRIKRLDQLTLGDLCQRSH